MYVRADEVVDGDHSKGAVAVVGSFFLSRFSSNCAAATRLAEMAVELGEEDAAAGESISRCVTVFYEPVSRSRIERGGYLLSRQVKE